MNKNNKIAVTILVSLVLGGCAVVEADPDKISLRHSVENNAFVLSEAQKHCKTQGKTAQLVQISPVDDSYIVRTVVSTFECI